MLKNINKAILASTLLILTSGCGDDAKETVQNLEEAPELQGRFVSDCTSIGINGLAGFSKRDNLMLAANQTQFETLYYEGTDCDSDKEVGGISYLGEFVVLDSENNEGDIKFELEEAFVELNSETLANIFNTIEFCGQSGYEDNGKTKVTEESKNFLCPIEDVPATLYGSYSFDDEDNTLYLSDDPVDLSSSEKSIKIPLVEVFASKFNKK